MHGLTRYLARNFALQQPLAILPEPFAGPTWGKAVLHCAIGFGFIGPRGGGGQWPEGVPGGRSGGDRTRPIEPGDRPVRRSKWRTTGSAFSAWGLGLRPDRRRTDGRPWAHRPYVRVRQDTGNAFDECGFGWDCRSCGYREERDGASIR